ncbi:MAG: TetR/AcrR family transcriptional regulator [archaeon]
MPEMPLSTKTTEEAIMAATYRALCENGYAETSISRIAEEFPKSKSLLYYHYEDKDELLTDFLSYLLDQLENELAEQNDEVPRDRLASLIGMLAPREMNREEVRFFQAMLEMRTQIPYNDAYRREFERTDDLILSALIATIEEGIENGTFNPVDPQHIAEFILASLYGILLRNVPMDDPVAVDTTRDALETYLDATLASEA